MQFPSHSDVEQEKNELLKLLKRKEEPLGIQEFINRKESPSTRNVFKLEAPVRFAQDIDIPDLFRVNHQVYKGYYPYRDLLDVQYVQEFTNPEKEHGFIGVYESPENHTIEGFLLMAVDREARKGNFRGLMVSPKYQHQLYLKNRVFETVYQGYKSYLNDVELWYGETRTAHSKGQKWMEETGSRPYAFFPNKDIFTKELNRESDVLQIAYNQNSLETKRNPLPRFIPIFKPIFDFINLDLGLPEVQPVAEPDLSLKLISKAKSLSKKCTVLKLPGLYNTSTCMIQTPKGSSIQFSINNLIKSAEKTKFSINSSIELAAILFRLRNFILEQKLEYFEAFVPLTDPKIQKIFLELGFSCFGYVPAWTWNKNQLEDCIIFGYYKSPVAWERTKLTHRSSSFTNIIQQFIKPKI